MDNQDKIVKLAKKILKKYSITAPPINVEKIAEQEGLQLQYHQFEDENWSGMLYRVGDTSIIAVNQLHSLSRRRFTIAHELGHYFLSDNDSSVFVDTIITRFRNEKSTLGIDSDEIAANRFAAELLMPEHMLRLDIYELIEDLEWAIPWLSSKYQVSEQAMTIRLITLKFIEPH